MSYSSAYHEAFCKLSGLNAQELPLIIRKKAAAGAYWGVCTDTTKSFEVA